MGGALDECSADCIGGLRALVDDFTINMMALPVALLGQVNAAGSPYEALRANLRNFLRYSAQLSAFLDPSL